MSIPPVCRHVQTAATQARSRVTPQAPGFEIHRQDAIREAAGEFSRPCAQQFAPFASWQHLNASFDLAERDDADELLGWRYAREPFAHTHFRARLDEFRHEDGIEEIAAHESAIFRPLSRERLNRRSTSRSDRPMRGHRLSQSDRLPPFSAFRFHSGHATTTATGFPCRVTVCGPREIASLTTSLNRCFACCSCHRFINARPICPD